MVTRISKSPEETRRLGEELGRSLRHGEVVALIGDLGAGKTEFVKGIARGLDIPGRIHSPTFALVNEYPSGRLPCHHLDLYRLESAAQIIGAGLEEYLAPRTGVTLVEWYDRWRDAGLPAPPAGLLVTITTLTETERQIAYEYFGA